MSLKWELDYHQGRYDEAKAKEEIAFHAILKVITDLGGKREHVDKAIGLWVDGTMASSDMGWHRAFRSEAEDKIQELRKLVDMDEDAELLK
jgi:hypothetical protein